MFLRIQHETFAAYAIPWPRNLKLSLHDIGATEIIKVLLPDDQIDHLAMRELPAVIFDGSPDFNYGFHNHTDIEFTAAEQQLLGYGHKFVIAGFGPSAKQLTAALRVMNRRLFLRDYFYQK